MLVLELGGEEHFDEETNSFLRTDTFPVKLEHSLLAMSKWESEFEKPFLDESEKTQEEIFYYIECMVVDENVNNDFIYMLTKEDVETIDKYMNSKKSATWFNEKHQPKGRGRSQEAVTSELIYYWMSALKIPYSCESWHLNRLLNLIKIANIKNQPEKKMGRRELMSQQARLNAERKAALGTSG